MRCCGLLVLSVMLALGCRSGEEQPSATPPEAEMAADDVVVLGKPLVYWVQKARTSQGEEEVSATVRALMEAARSGDAAAVVTAADALQVIGPPAAPASELLAGKLRDDVPPWVRVAAADALTAMGEGAVPALVDVVESGPGFAPVRAGLALGAMGPAARSAVPVLKRVGADSSSVMQGRVDALLAQIEGTGPAEAMPRGLGGAAGAIQPVAAATGVPNGDWPQFHGPRRDGISTETGLLDSWPEGGPPLLWKLEGLGRGYSTVSIAGGALFTMGDRTTDADSSASQYLLAYDLEQRRERWAVRVGPPHKDGGPRSTPTVSGDSVFALGTSGDLVKVDMATGAERWRKNLERDFGGRMMSGWRYSESPLVDGDHVICTPGGEDAALVALARDTGDVVWRCELPELGSGGKDGAAYSSPVLAEIAGTRQVVQLLGRGVVGVDAADGRFLWGYNRIANTTANITSPVVRGDQVFVSTAYGTGSALLEITRDGDAFQAKEVYFLGPGTFQNHHGGVVLVGDYLYGGHGQNRGHPACIELASGKVIWKEKAPERGSAAALYADGHIIFRYDRGLVVLVEATPEAFRIQGRLEPITGAGPAWPHPVIHNGRLYLRHGDVLACYDLRKRAE